MLSHSGPLGLAHQLLYVESLPFDCISSEDCKLMQLKTASENSPQMQMPFFGHSFIYSYPQVTLVHLTSNTVPLGLCTAIQEVPQKLVRLGSSLVVSLMGFLEHLLGMRNLHLASSLSSFGPNWLLEIL
jgi:hypothetical protein